MEYIMDKDYILQLEVEKNILHSRVGNIEKKLSLALIALEAIEESNRAEIAKIALIEIKNIDYL